MRRSQFYYYGNMTPFAALGLALLALGVFFLTLPILIAALVVFGSVGAYMAWRINKAIKKAEEEMLRNGQHMKDRCNIYSEDEIIIDITPEGQDKERLFLEDDRS